MCFRFLTTFLMFGVLCMAQQQPDVAAQKQAMKKLDFLVGKWSGDASVWRGPGGPMKIRQSEEIEYRLGGLGLLVEGTGRNADGKIVFQALATISFDDLTSTYRFRSHSDGRYLDTEVKVTRGGFSWGFEGGPLKVTNVMHVNEKGEWMETPESTFGANPPRKTVEMVLQKQP